MKYYKYTHYLYLILAFLFVIDGIKKSISEHQIVWINFLFVILCVFMFLFRRRYLKKIENNNQEKNIK